MKRFLALLLCVLMLTAMLPLSVWAEEPDAPDAVTETPVEEPAPVTAPEQTDGPAETQPSAPEEPETPAPEAPEEPELPEPEDTAQDPEPEALPWEGLDDGAFIAYIYAPENAAHLTALLSDTESEAYSAFTARVAAIADEEARAAVREYLLTLMPAAPEEPTEPEAPEVPEEAAESEEPEVQEEPEEPEEEVFEYPWMGLSDAELIDYLYAPENAASLKKLLANTRGEEYVAFRARIKAIDTPEDRVLADAALEALAAGQTPVLPEEPEEEPAEQEEPEADPAREPEPETPETSETEPGDESEAESEATAEEEPDDGGIRSSWPIRSLPAPAART